MRNLGDRRVGELAHFRKHVDRLVALGREPVADLGDVLLWHSIYDHAEQRAALVGERIASDADGGDGAVRRAASDDDENGRAKLVREVGVQPEVEGGSSAGEVGALAEHEVAGALESLIRLDDALAKLLVGA